MQDMAVDVLVATHHADGKAEMLIQGSHMADHDLHMIGGQMMITGGRVIILTCIGGTGSALCQMEVMSTADRPELMLYHQQIP